MKKFLFLLVFIPFLAGAQSNTADIAKALNAGNADALGSYFDESIELSILEEEGIYNKAQALQKVRKFMTQYKVTGFAEVHQGASRSSDSQYVIGNLTTSDGTFRVYMYLANTNGKMIIQEFRFDSE
ncbi:MAG: DUF4783 domain-containing protein [Saprospiraceae bacterium]